MKDLADNITTDLFPVKKSRGRPATATAQTNADRQRAYRQRKKFNMASNEYQVLRVPMLDSNLFALERLARYYGVSTADVVAKLIKDKEAAVVANFSYTSPEYDAYYRLDDDSTSYLD